MIFDKTSFLAGLRTGLALGRNPKKKPAQPEPQAPSAAPAADRLRREEENT